MSSSQENKSTVLKPSKGTELTMVEDPNFKSNISSLKSVEVNRNDKRYEDPFEDDGAYADDLDDE